MFQACYVYNVCLSQAIILTLVAALSSQNLPELLGTLTVRVDSLLDDLYVVGAAAQVSFGLDEVGQLFSLQETGITLLYTPQIVLLDFSDSLKFNLMQLLG